MTYRKFKADYLFDGNRMTQENSVLITQEDGTVEDILPLVDAGEGIETFRGILSPGFVNCHCHLELSHMKGVIPERTGMVDFLISVIRQRGAQPSAATQPSAEDQTSAAAISQAEGAMLDSGIVAVGDICNTTDTIPQKAAGRLFYHNFIETMGFSEAGAVSRFEHSVNIFKSFAEAYHYPIETNSIVPHAPYSVSPKLFDLIAGFPGNQLLTIHNQESEAENTFLRTGQGDFHRLYAALGLDISTYAGTGKRSLASFLPHFYRNQTIILVHNVATSPIDIQTANGPELFYCLCPNANLYITGELPDVPMMIRSGCRIVLGTDSLASNHQLNILEEAKTLQARWPQLATASILNWATMGGAAALQLGNIIGSFTKGKTPGIVLIEGGEGDRLTQNTRSQRIL